MTATERLRQLRDAKLGLSTSASKRKLDDDEKAELKKLKADLKLHEKIEKLQSQIQETKNKLQLPNLTPRQIRNEIAEINGEGVGGGAGRKLPVGMKRRPKAAPIGRKKGMAGPGR